MLMTVKVGKWCLRYPEDHKFVALDSASGGYPYPVDVTDKSVHDFKTREKAEAYAGVTNREGFIPVCLQIQFNYEIEM